MASFQIHEDQENTGRDVRLKHGTTSVFGQQKRNVLGAIDNKVHHGHIQGKGKQPLGVSNAVNNANKIQNENAFSKICKAQIPVVPVAQFQAFKVYEDSNEELVQRSIQSIRSKRVEEIFRNVYKGTEDDCLVTKQEVLEKVGVLDIPKPEIIDIAAIDSPMSIEKPDAETSFSSVLSPSTRNKNNLFFELDEYRDDIYEYLRTHEKKQRPKANYMRKQPDITHNMRTILVDWLVEVAEEYKLHTETLYLAISYIDRFLSFMSVVRAKLQLVGTAAMFIASKYEEIFPPDVTEFVYITDDTYNKRQVIRMEILILKVLDFDLSIPTAYTFITAIGISCRLSEKTKFLAQYVSELALLESDPTLEIYPSMMACASIAYARHTLGDQLWNQTLAESTGYELRELEKAITFLHSFHKKASGLAQQAIQEKYKSQKYLHVATITPLEEDIKFE